MSSPLMVFEFEKKPSSPSSENRFHNETDISQGTSSSESRASKSTAHDDTWSFVSVPSNGETVHIQEVLLTDGVALKHEIMNEELLKASQTAAEQRTTAQKKLDEIEQSSETIKNKKVGSLAHTTAIALSSLPQREVILEGLENKSLRRAIQEVETHGKEIISALEADTTNDCEQQIITTTELIQKMQQFMLGSHTPFYITAAKNQLSGLFDKASKKNSPQDFNNDFQQLQDLLEKIRTDFLFAEAESPEEALEVITKIIEELEMKIKALALVCSNNNTVNLVDPKDQEAFENTIKRKEETRVFFEKAMCTCEQIQNELRIETQCGSLSNLKESIDHDLTRFGLSHDEKVRQASQRLKTILEAPEFNTPVFSLATPQSPLHFLADIQSANNNEMIMGEHGKVFLTTNKTPREAEFLVAYSENVSEKNRKKWINGIDIIRFGLARKHGMQAVGYFDTDPRFQIRRRYNVCLFTEELKQFLNTRITMPSSHFLSPLTSMEKFMKRLNQAHDDDLIKWDEEVLKFNPFLPELMITPREEDLVKIHERELAAGIDHARKAVEKKLKACAIVKISNNRIQNILKRFDDKFKSTHPLTAKALRDFISEEEKKIEQLPSNVWEDYVTDESKKWIMSGAVSGSSSVAVAVFAHHLLPLYLYCFSAGIIIGFIISHILPLLV